MIKSDQLVEAGRLNKPHGINGEIVATLYDNIDTDKLECIILDIDGIFVPFFIDEIRPKGHETVILHIDGINDDGHIRELSNKTIYLTQDNDALIEIEGDGMYASDIIGYSITTDIGTLVGEIVDVEDSTDNALFIVSRPDDTIVYIPIAEEMIESISPENRQIVMSLPDGLLEL